MENICNICYMKNSDVKKIIDYTDITIFRESVKLCIPDIAFSSEIKVFLCTNCYEGLREFNRFRLLCLSNETNMKELFQNGDSEPHPEVEGRFASVYIPEMHKQEDRESDVDPGEDMDKFIPQVKMEVETDCDIRIEDLPKPTAAADAKKAKSEGAKPPKPKVHVCGYCNKAFSRSSNLSVHVRHHIGLKPYKCDECNKTFTRQATLIIHKRMHSGDKPYSCQICNKGFIDASHLTKHMKVHSDDRPFVCAVCGKAFARRGDLIKHDRVHSGLKPYKCQVCQRGFADHSNLSKHKRVHTK